MVDNGQNKINRTLERQQNKVISLIDKVLEDLSKEIEARREGLIDSNEIPSKVQLKSIFNDLCKMKGELSPEKSYPTYTRQIVDSWDIHSKLGDKLLSVAQEYEKLKEPENFGIRNSHPIFKKVWNKFMRYNFIKNQVGNQFFPVNEKEIEEVESTLGLKFPTELREFLIEVGYGFLKKSEYNINRIMGPASIKDARLKVNDFEFYPDIEAYEELEDGKLIFFEANESALLLIDLSEEKNNSIYYDEIKIADSLEEKKVMEDDRYYIDME